MVKIPEFLLRTLYVKGSLQNIDGGFEFQMKNELGPVRIIGARPLTIDRKPVPIVASRFVHADREAGFEEVTADSSVLIRKGESLRVRVEGTMLRQGRRTLGIDVIVKDVGQVRFSVGDKVV